MKVNFMIIGCQKCGTTSLWKYLSGHPEIYMAALKETHYFSEHYEKSIDEYHKLFKEQHINGEVTGNYIYWKKAIPRIRRYNPQMRLIVIMRDPSERAFSQYKMQLGKNKNLPSFMKWLNKEAIQKGLYYKQIKRVLKYFPRNQLLLMRMKELKNATQAVNKVCDFIGARRVENVSNEIWLPYERKPWTENLRLRDKDKIIKYFKKDIQRLEGLTNWDLTTWKNIT